LQNAAANLAENPAGAILGIPVTGLQLLGIDLLEAQLLNLQNTAAVNFAGNPALAIPIRVHHGSTPVTSLQLVGRPFSEAELLNAGHLIESKH
jgi:Asp-tRNA(Asn)/Glu-tRNA(Gln) amidotransferase A subunit family amidase